jgi:uncharacterized lipoprotein YmbA
MRTLAMRALVVSAVLMVGACVSVDQINSYFTLPRDRAIDQDISATHLGGAATIDNIASSNAAWRISQH